MMKNWKKSLLIVLAAFLLICIGITIVEIQTKFIRRTINLVIYDNKDHYLSCEQLPTASEVMQVIEEHQDVIQEIEQVKPGYIGMDIDTFSCPGKADIVFWYGTRQERITIESIINDETFFGVPYRLHNR